MTKTWRIRKVLIGVGIIAALLGGVWALQGAGALGGSPMTGDPFWTVTGSIVFVVGLLVALFGWRMATRVRGV